MFMSLYLPISGNATNILLLFGLGGIVGFLSGLFGVGGGFLMTPLLIMVGIPSTVAAASDSNQIVAASTSGHLCPLPPGQRRLQDGAFCCIIGGVLGGTLGVQLIKVLRAMGNADFVIKITYVVMLGVIGGYMFVESLQSMRKKARWRPERVATPPPSPPFTPHGPVPALPDALREIGGDPVAAAAPGPGGLRGDPGGHHGGGRRLHHGAGHGLSAAHAHARGGGHQPLPDPVHLHQRHHHAVHHQPHGGPGPGHHPAVWAPPWGPSSGCASAGASRATSSRFSWPPSCSLVMVQMLVSLVLPPHLLLAHEGGPLR